MALELKLSQKLGQSLVMTPQLRQAIKLLQLGRGELSEVLERELLENPLLEDAREPDITESENIQTNEENSYDDWSSVGSGGNIHSGFEHQIESPEGLASHITWQLRTLGLSGIEETIAYQIIGNLDRDGYLRSSLNEICDELGVSETQIAEEVLSVIQTLDPSGVAARDLEECLRLQLQQFGMQATLAYRIVERHLPLIEAGKYDEIAKLEGAKIEEISLAVREIRRLDPHPGRIFNSENPIYITPDIYVRKEGDTIELSLNEQGMPKLRLNQLYHRMLKTSSGESSKFIQERFKSASWLIRSIEQRQRTIFKVTESIFKHQFEFLDHGVGKMKPLILKEIAKDVEMHESTVSRVTTNKYVHTPQGVYELKYFFSSCIRGQEGDVSSQMVKDRISAMIDSENCDRPLSDQALVKKLKAEGVDIARRTVAKYRESLNIPSSTKRKKRI